MKSIPNTVLQIVNKIYFYNLYCFVRNLTYLKLENSKFCHYTGTISLMYNSWNSFDRGIYLVLVHLQFQGQEIMNFFSNMK